MFLARDRSAIARKRRFEQVLQPHLNAAYNLARWLTRSDHDAEDVVQEACLRAYKFLDGFRGGDGRAWLLTIVRNTYYTAYRQSRVHRSSMSADESSAASEEDYAGFDVDQSACSPEETLLRDDDARVINEAIEQLPLEYREVIVLRELQDLSYREIAGILDVPLGTVMSRLARARKRLWQSLRTNTAESRL